MNPKPFSISLNCLRAEDSLNLGRLVASQAYPGLVIRLEGGLGAGKTVFARGFAQGLGITETVTSPSYPIIQEYLGRLPLFHFDFYRLNSEEEVADTGARDLFWGPQVCLVEWPERAGRLLDGANLLVTIGIQADQSRRVCLSTESAELWQGLNLPELLSDPARGGPIL